MQQALKLRVDIKDESQQAIIDVLHEEGKHKAKVVHMFVRQN